MPIRHTKKEAIKIVVSCAQQYEQELNGRSLLFVCMDKHGAISCHEFSFRPENFLHLTGLKTIHNERELKRLGQKDAEVVSATDFYSRCINQKLSPKDFELADGGTTDMKLDVLPSVLNKNLSAKMIGAYNSSKPLLYTEKLAGDTNACMGVVQDSATKLFFPNTMLKEDLRVNVHGYVRVILAYRKEQSKGKYEEITYAAKKIDWSQIKVPTPFDDVPLPSNSAPCQ